MIPVSAADPSENPPGRLHGDPNDRSDPRLAQARPRRSSLFIALPFILTAIEAQTVPAGTKKIDPCSLLTKAEIQEILGLPVKDGKPNTTANAAVGQPCEYVVGDYGAFSILVKTAGPGETADAIMAGLAKSKIKTEAAPGFGDRSFFAFPGYGMLQLNTFKGTQYVIMTLLVPGKTEEAQKAPAGKADDEGPAEDLISNLGPAGLAAQFMSARAAATIRRTFGSASSSRRRA